MVDVSHDNDDRASRLEVFFLVLALIKQLLLDGDKDFLLDLRAHLLGNQCRGIKVDGLRDVRHDTQLEQFLDDVCRGALEAGCQLADVDLVRNHDLELNLLDLLALALQSLELLLLLLTTLAGERTACVRLALDLLLALLHAIRLLRNEGVDALVVPREVDVSASARVDAVNLLGLALLLIFILIGGNRRGRLLRLALRMQNLMRLVRLCRLALLLLIRILLRTLLLCRLLLRLLALCLRLRLSLGGLLRRLLADNLCRRCLALRRLTGQDLFHILNRIFLGDIIKNNI